MDCFSPRQVALAFVGTLLGAGFVSGQEIMQFFGVFSGFGLAGMVGAVALICFFSIVFVYVAQKAATIKFDEVLIQWDLPWLKMALSAFFVLFLLGVVVIMIAGAGTLVGQKTGISAVWGSAAMTALLGWMAIKGARGVVASSGVIVPALIVAALGINAAALFRFAPEPIVARPISGANRLLGNWAISMLSYVSYSVISAMSVLAPLSARIKGLKDVCRGIGLGTGLLLVIFSSILLPLVLYPSMLAAEEMPMLTLAGKISAPLGIIYAILLFCGMFGSALSCLFGALSRIHSFKELDEKKLIGAVMLATFLGSLAGFKNLVSVLFPLCGYVGFLGLGGLLAHFASIRKAESRAKAALGGEHG